MNIIRHLESLKCFRKEDYFIVKIAPQECVMENYHEVDEVNRV